MSKARAEASNTDIGSVVSQQQRLAINSLARFQDAEGNQIEAVRSGGSGGESGAPPSGSVD
jgi:hypothetical protein